MTIAFRLSTEEAKLSDIDLRAIKASAKIVQKFIHPWEGIKKNFSHGKMDKGQSLCPRQKRIL